MAMSKIQSVQKYIKELSRGSNGKIAVLFSGGIDSGLVAYAAKGFADAVTIDSEFVFRYKIEDAINFAKKHEIKHRVIRLSCLDEKIKNNPLNRCYFCKTADIKELKNQGYGLILDGTNTDDLRETRPGLQALKEENVISPLVELNIGKENVRSIMREIDKGFSLKPHESCIASRIPFNSRINVEKLNRIEKAEDYIRNLGISIVRVRDYFPEARIEVSIKNFKLVVENRRKIVEKFREMRYKTVTLNLEEYNKSGIK